MSKSGWPVSIRIRFVLNRVLKRLGPAYIRAHRHSSQHRLEILGSRECGCFYCLEVFPPTEIVEWIDEGATSMCPRCGIDSVIGSGSKFPITPRFLASMHRYWFDRTYKIRFSKGETHGR